MNADYFMRLAIEQALSVPDYPFGAVIVHRATNEIIARGFNQAATNPTLHGEMVAINQCAAQHSAIDWQAFDLYTTAEPCAMCQSAILWAGIHTVYYGTSIAHLQQQGWQQINLRAAEIIAHTPFRYCRLLGAVLEAECNALFAQAKLRAGKGQYFL